MPAFFVDSGAVRGDDLILEGEEAHHVRVRRYRLGDEIDVIDGEGGAYRVRILEFGSGRAVTRIVARAPELGESPVRLHLAAAILKGSRFDDVVEKATEVGVAAILPVLVERGVARPADGARRGERWRRVARAAAKQCGRSRVPDIAEPLTLPAAARALADVCDRLVLADPRAGADLTAVVGRGVGQVALFVGPEGGFEPQESDALLAIGARPFAWGQRTLRGDTAAIVFAALVLDAAGGAQAPVPVAGRP